MASLATVIPRNGGLRLNTPTPASRRTIASFMTARTVALAIVTLLVVELAIALVFGPTRFVGSDEANYVGIGLNLFEGRGPLTPFSVFYPYHSPLWPAMVVAPQAWFGVDALAWAHVLNVVSAIATVLLTAWLGWRVRPIVGAIGASLLVSFAYFVSLGHTLGLDLPAASLSLAYLAIGITAVRRGSIPLALAAGATFAIAFLVKEIALPFAPVPFLTGLVGGRSPALVARLTACAVSVALVGTAWWFVVYAQATGDVYRLGTPAWTLGPLAVGIGLLALLGWFAPHILTSRRSPTRRVTVALGWVGSVAWLILLSAFFAYSRVSIGRPFLSVNQVLTYGSAWLDQLGIVLAVGGVGAVLAAIARIRHERDLDFRDSTIDDRWVSAVDDLLVSVVCSLPLVLLVVSVGELPRHYIAQAACLLALGAAGWLETFDRILRGGDRATRALGIGALPIGLGLMLPVAVGRRAIEYAFVVVAIAGLAAIVVEPVRRRLTPLAAVAPIALAILLFAGSTVVLAATSVRGPRLIDEAKAHAVATTADWIQANIQPGSRIAFGGLLARETADHLLGTYDMLQIRESQDVLFDPRAPLGLRRHGVPPATDWIALDTSPNVVGTFYGYQAGRLEEQLKNSGSRIWVFSTINGGKSTVPILPAIDQANGIQVLAHWSWPYQPGTLDTYVLGIDPNNVSIRGEYLYVSQPALGELIDLLAAAGDQGRAAAQLLEQRVRVVPDDPAGRSLEAELKALGDR